MKLLWKGKKHHYLLAYSPLFYHWSCHGCCHCVSIWFWAEWPTFWNLTSVNTILRCGTSVSSNYNKELN